MSEINEIRPAYPVTHVKRRDPEERKQDQPPSNKDTNKKPRVNHDDDSEPHQIDEYV